MSISEVLEGKRSWWVEHTDVLAGLRALPSGCVSTVCTSIPYWGLRSYNTEPQVWGGDASCAHSWGDRLPGSNRGGSGPNGKNGYGEGYGRAEPRGAFCQLCGSWRGELGLEPDPALFIEHIVEIFREVYRVMAPSSTLWLNCGDSYVAGPTGHQDISAANGKAAQMFAKGGRYRVDNLRKDTGRHFSGLPAKSLMMMPARVALALQDAGWILRSEIVWCKRAPMPESCQDRPTSATEKIFLFAKQGRYFYDADAIRERNGTEATWEDYAKAKEQSWPSGGIGLYAGAHKTQNAPALTHPAGRNAWNYWLLSPEPYAAAHFATFPSEIPRRAILAGSSERGVCPECLAPWKRVVEKELVLRKAANGANKWRGDADPMARPGSSDAFPHGTNKIKTTGWAATCTHGLEPIPALVLDPFSGSGTTGLVAKRLGRRYLGLELNKEYCAMSEERIRNDAPLEAWAEEQERQELEQQITLGI